MIIDMKALRKVLRRNSWNLDSKDLGGFYGLL